MSHTICAKVSICPYHAQPHVLSNFLISSNLVILVIFKFHLLFCPLSQSLRSVSSFILPHLLLCLCNCNAMILVSAFVVSCIASQVFIPFSPLITSQLTHTQPERPEIHKGTVAFPNLHEMPKVAALVLQERQRSL